MVSVFIGTIIVIIISIALSIFHHKFMGRDKNPIKQVDVNLINLGGGWYGRESKEHIGIFFNSDAIKPIDIYNKIKIGEEEVEYFSHIKEGEKFISITGHQNIKGGLFLNYSDKTYHISELNFHEIERPKRYIVESGIFDEIAQAPFEIDLNRLRRVRETKPIYKQVKKTELELYTEIYEFINDYETKERLC